MATTKHFERVDAGAILDFERQCISTKPDPDYIRDLFEKQRKVLSDLTKRIACLCTRRAGKTHFVAARLLKCADENPGGTSLYIALTKGHARRNLGKAFRRLKKKYNLPIRETERDGQLLWIHENGHEIWLAGCKDKTECEKFRGDFYDLAIIDEGQSYPMPNRRKVTAGEREDEANRELLEYLVNDVLDPALLDRDAPLIITGTPGVLPIGFFWEITTGDGKSEKWTTHEWSVFDNPHIPHARKWLDEKMRKNGWSEDHPTVQREWRGKWVADISAIIYQFVANRNGWFPENNGRRQACWNALPGKPNEWFLVLGIDLGHDDATSFTLTASRRGMPHVYVLRTWGGSEMTTAERAAEWHRIRSQLSADGFKLAKTVVDTGGLGKSIAHDMKKLYGVTCEAAEKKFKAGAIRMVRDAMTGGRLLFNHFECGAIISEMSVLPWNDERTDHHSGYSDHWCDGLLYAFREHPMAERWDEVPPEPGTPEAIDAEARHLKNVEAQKTAIELSGMSRAAKRRALRRVG